MKLIFLDESGYSKNWVEDRATQPFHVLAGIAIDADAYVRASEKLRLEFVGIEELEMTHPLGQSFEIKAKEISAGKGWWKSHSEQRNDVRNLMLSFPECNAAEAFLVVIDKESHYQKYVSPESPDKVAFQYMFERLQWFLRDTDDFALCIYDQTKFLDDDMHKASMGYMRDGSPVVYWSEYYGHVSTQFSIDRIKEFYLGRSENSIGLQIADYFAHFGYQYFKTGRPNNCKWWSILKNGLYHKDGNLNGYGLKIFP